MENLIQLAYHNMGALCGIIVDTPLPTFNRQYEKHKYTTIHTL